MKTIHAALIGSLIFLLSAIAQAGSATWDLNPGSGDWNTATNWTPMTAPNASTDSATFGLSNTTAVSNSTNTVVNGITFAPGASSFTITVSAAHTLTLSGAGITNDSGTTQNFVAPPSSRNALRLLFNNGATAGSGTFFTMNGGGGSLAGGFVAFNNNSTAANGTFTNNGTSLPAVSGTEGLGGVTVFNDSATAGNGTFINNGATVSNAGGGSTDFNNNSTAANGTFTNNGATVSGGEFGGGTEFDGTSSAGNATITNKGGTVSGASGGVTGIGGFLGTATAGNATITNNGAGVSGASGGVTEISGFLGTGTAGNATITNKGGTVSGASGGVTEISGFFESPSFFGSSTAANATIVNNGASVNGGGGGQTLFTTDFPNSFGTSTAGSATLTANGGTNGGQGGGILLMGESTGGTSRVEVFGNGFLDISEHVGPGVTVGSVEGDGNILLGANNLTVGSNNISTTFSGVLQDGGQNAGSGGSLTKIGSGTLILSGANTYSGDTHIGIFLNNSSSGVLQVDGSIASNTIVNHGGTLAGDGTVKGNVTNDGIVSPGDGPGTLTVNGNYTQLSQPFAGDLLINIAGANAGQFSVLNVLGTANLSGLLDPVLLNGFVPTIGESFTFLDYSAVDGTLFIFDRNIDNVAEHWNVTYQTNDAILTVAAGNVPVPDRASTLLLLTLGLLALATYRQKCWQ